MGENSPAFQFYPKDFLTDVKQIGMSLPEVGAYWRLCCHCWLAGSLPTDLRQLARLAGATNRQIKEMWPAIGPCFIERDGVLIHKRLEREREKQDTYRRRQSDKGKASAEMRAALEANRKQNSTLQPTLQPTFGTVSGNADASTCGRESDSMDTTVSKNSQQNSAVGSTVVDSRLQPDLNHAPANGQPNLNSSSPSSSPSPISNLQTAVTPYAPVALAGSLPRDHVRHGWCSKRGKCVPEFLHEEFIRSIGGDRKAADQRLRAFYEARERGWGEGPIGDDPIRLWRREFAASFPSVAPVAVARDRTTMLRDATNGFLK